MTSVSPPYSSILKPSPCIKGGDPERAHGGSGAPSVWRETLVLHAVAVTHDDPWLCLSTQIPIRGQLVRSQAAACLSPKTLLPPSVVPPSIHSSAENMLHVRLEKRAEQEKPLQVLVLWSKWKIRRIGCSCWCRLQSYLRFETVTSNGLSHDGA